MNEQPSHGHVDSYCIWIAGDGALLNQQPRYRLSARLFNHCLAKMPLHFHSIVATVSSRSHARPFPLLSMIDMVIGADSSLTSF